MVDRLELSSSPIDPPAISLRSLAPAIYLPAIIYEIGSGAIAPVVALTALDLGSSAHTAGYMLALLGIGMVAGYLPAGIAARRLGDRRAMMAASALATLALLVCLLASSTAILAAGLLVLGACNSAYYLARQSYLTAITPAHLRGRAISTLGGSHRIGLLIGPFAGAGAIGLCGLRAAYVVAIVASISAAILLWIIPDVAQADQGSDRARPAGGALTILIAQRRMFLTLGLAALAGNAVRASRQTVLPLWADHIGLSPEATSLIFGIASAMDVAMFYPAGKIMDKYGRLAVALPAMFLLGSMTMATPLAHSFRSLMIVTMIMSFGNGIGSGIFQTLGADLAPSESRVAFLSLWRVMTDSGSATGPVLVSVVTSAWTLAAGAVAIGAVGMFSVVGLARWTSRYCAYATYAMVRRRRAEASLIPADLTSS